MKERRQGTVRKLGRDEGSEVREISNSRKRKREMEITVAMKTRTR